MKNSKCVALSISGINCNRRYTMNRVRTFDSLDLPNPQIDVSRLKQLHSHISQLDIQQPFKEKPLILIGEEHAFLMTSLDLREGAVAKPYAIRTRLGWLIHGKFTGKPDSSSRNTMASHVSVRTIMSSTI